MIWMIFWNLSQPKINLCLPKNLITVQLIWNTEIMFHLNQLDNKDMSKRNQQNQYIKRKTTQSMISATYKIISQRKTRIKSIDILLNNYTNN